ncbi:MULTISPECIES: hypothetical protein [Delftia]|uniref:Uncharacterized protein n=1 Tax=Delftia lacustris TaxID=558537 RepID=A0A1H3SLA7_9BURK|nr:hypothetical protein [Delftia lacustris]SDZ38365.1 hypothetical protein SAMN05421547_12120 [Delftia lacustris]
MSFDPITNAGVKALQGQVNTVQSQTTALTTKLAQIESALANLGTAQTASRRPLRVTEYTSGSGTHTFLAESTHQYITLIGAGGAGKAGYETQYERKLGYGGNAGYELRLRTALKNSLTYEVGASVNKDGISGGNSRLGSLWVAGGSGGSLNEPGSATPQIGFGGISIGESGTPYKGGSSSLGEGGQCRGYLGTPPHIAATGYGSGGGGSTGAGGFIPGTGGYIRIEEY